MAKFFKKRGFKYGSVSLMLTVFVLAAVVIFNVIAAVLCMRYDWMYVEMFTPKVFSVSENCRDYISEYVIPEVDAVNKGSGEDKKINIIFCDTEENILDDDTLKYVAGSVYEIQGMFEGYIEIDYLDIWQNPSRAASYGVTLTTDVICEFNGRHETMNLTDFFIYSYADQTAPVAYNGEKIIASCLMRVTQTDAPMCYLTVNHAEAYGDYEFIRNTVEAGYTVGFLDLYADEIPEDCDLLVTYDPKQDMTAGEAGSKTSEIAKLDEYMSKGGKYMVFLSANTFASGGFENLEGFLADWGVKYMHKAGEDSVEDCYLVRDNANSLTVDGYTVLARRAESGFGAEVLEGSDAPNAFGSSTYIVAPDMFEPDGKGNFVSEDGRMMSPLLIAHSSAEAWANGRAVARASDGDFALMTMSKKECENGENAYLIASASVAFASEDHMQSSVLGNSRTLTEIIRYMGKDNAPSSLVFKPFDSVEIESLTTMTANTLTVFLAAAPALIIAVVGVFVLVRRKNR